MLKTFSTWMNVLQTQRMRQSTVLAPVIDLKRGSNVDDRQISDTPPHTASGLKVRSVCAQACLQLYLFPRWQPKNVTELVNSWNMLVLIVSCTQQLVCVSETGLCSSRLFVRRCPDPTGWWIWSHVPQRLWESVEKTAGGAAEAERAGAAERAWGEREVRVQFTPVIQYIPVACQQSFHAWALWHLLPL